MRGRAGGRVLPGRASSRRVSVPFSLAIANLVTLRLRLILDVLYHASCVHTYIGMHIAVECGRLGRFPM